METRVQKQWIIIGVAGAMVLACQADVVLSTDFESYAQTATTTPTTGLESVFSGGSDVGSSFADSGNGGQQWVAANPEANGNTSLQALGGGDQTVNFSQGIFYFGGNMLLDGMTISYDFYNAGTDGNANEGVRIALRNSADAAQGFFLRNDRDGLVKINGTDDATANAGEGVWQHFTINFTLDGTDGLYDVAYAITNLESGSEILSSTLLDQNAGANLADGLVSGLFVEISDPNNPILYQGYVDNIVVDAVPEPATLGIVAFAGGAMLWIRRRFNI
ncbi:hypothetical protein PDESU_01868 [Pontiella desulfatans]|uniref:PEP-CTERM protein-sorting domain-containing protein n=1 Tax=Pontiella desulfatans TaxID=2750659 RepID=A0A6C2U066_PONDE|nr:PEP-CTERM sorting domain-containing protein [Pontiella desulfatans]VGO13312.1 hypothetical protein PDESU_01868 [Pontiella desulfatans]